MSFARDVLSLCDHDDLPPHLDGSLAVFAYTQDPGLEVHDIDLNCSESDFPRLHQILNLHGFASKVTDWHVLQIRRDGLKVEFGATEYWMQGITDDREILEINDVQLLMVSVESLRELYRRGLADTAETSDGADPAKHRAQKEKLRLLDSIRT